MGTVPMRSSATTVLPLVPSSWPCLTSVPGLDVQCGQAVEDAPEARAVVDDDGAAVASAKVLGQQHMAAGGHDHRILRLLRLMTTFVEVRPP